MKIKKLCLEIDITTGYTERLFRTQRTSSEFAKSLKYLRTGCSESATKNRCGFFIAETICTGLATEKGEKNMIKIENTEVFGFETAIRGMRNPMNSWDKSDSCECSDIPCGFVPEERPKCYGSGSYCIGDNDFDLMNNLVAAGSDHSKFMRMIHVQCDVTAPRYWWAEYDTYKVGTVANSCSTMHKIADKEFTIDDFSHDQLNLDSMELLKQTIELLNYYREQFIETRDKNFWWQMIQLLPQSYNQKRTIDLNYAVLRNMYNARKCHKLDEWREFCRWIDSLPYSELITSNPNAKYSELEKEYHEQIRNETIVQLTRNYAEIKRISKKDNLDMCDRQILEEVAEKMKGAF